MICLQAVCQAISLLCLSHSDISPSGLLISPSFSLLGYVCVSLRDTKCCPPCSKSTGQHWTQTLHIPVRNEAELVALCSWKGLRLGPYWSHQEAAGWNQTQSRAGDPPRLSESKASVTNMQPFRFMHNMPKQLAFLQV